MNDKTPPEQEPQRSRLALGAAATAGCLAAILRVVSHPLGFSGVGGLGIFGGARLRGWQAYLLPLVIMFVSDLALWASTLFDPLYSMAHISRLYVYTGFMIYVAIGRWLADKNSIGSVALAATLGGVLFFVFTNFCTWLFQPWEIGYDLIQPPFKYERDLGGLATCFGWALGFYRQEVAGMDYPFMVVTNFPMALLIWTVLGDVFFTSVYIFVHEKLSGRVSPAHATPLPATTLEVQS